MSYNPAARPGLPNGGINFNPGKFNGMMTSFQNNGVPNQQQGWDNMTLISGLLNALGAGIQAYTTAQTAKKEREFRERKYNEGGSVREEGRKRLLEPQLAPSPNYDFHSSQQTMPGSTVAAPPPPGPNAARDEELQRILRARLGGQY